MKSKSVIQETEKLNKIFKEYAKFYEMSPSQDLKDITDDILQSPYVKKAEKKSIQELKRRIFVFTYLSDGLQIKGLISFLPDPKNHPLLVLLRGGNRIFGILNPGSDLMCFKNYSVISTMYRDGISEGNDEFGGLDVNDVKNLIDYIPELEIKLKLFLSSENDISFQTQKKYLLGKSRGGMQMFLALSRFPELQNYFSKIVSLSGLLDIRESMTFRSDMKEMFIKDFGLKKKLDDDKTDDEWIDKRNALLTVDHIKSELPILIIQGTNDIRISLEEGHRMVSKLQSLKKNVTYLEVENADHCLHNRVDKVELIHNWIERSLI